MNQTNNINIQKFALNLGLLAAVFRILLDVIPKTLDFSPFAWYSTYGIAFILEVIFVIWAIKKFKTINLNLNLKDALQVGIIIMMTLGFIFSLWNYIFDTFIDPEFTMRKTIEIMERFNPDGVAEIEDQFANADKSKSWLGIILYTLWFIFLGAVISLIGGAALKSKEPK